MYMNSQVKRNEHVEIAQTRNLMKNLPRCHQPLALISLWICATAGPWRHGGYETSSPRFGIRVRGNRLCRSSRAPALSSSTFPKSTYLNPSFSRMRSPPFPTFVRAFYTLSNFTTATSHFFAHSSAQLRAFAPTSNRITVLESMPTIPFLGSLFSTSASNSKEMADYPVKKSDDEWQAILNKGIVLPFVLQTQR